MNKGWSSESYGKVKVYILEIISEHDDFMSICISISTMKHELVQSLSDGISLG